MDKNKLRERFLNRWCQGTGIYSERLNAELDQLINSTNKEANEFIIDIAKALKMDTDGIGFDGLKFSIDDFKEGVNSVKEERNKPIIEKLETIFKIHIIMNKPITIKEMQEIIDFAKAIRSE